MYILDTFFSENEKLILSKCLGDHYIILDRIESDCFTRHLYGEYFYNDCFSPTDSEYYRRIRYKKVIPKRIIKFYHYYIMEAEDSKGFWDKGELDKNGNLKFDSSTDDLEFALSTL